MTSEEAPQRHFVRVREERGHRKGRGRLIKYFLEDNTGTETLAAIGEETAQGDAHYHYHNEDTFTAYGELSCHNRRELNSWLDSVIRDSKAAAGLTPRYIAPLCGPEDLLRKLPVCVPAGRIHSHAPWLDAALGC